MSSLDPCRLTTRDPLRLISSPSPLRGLPLRTRLRGGASRPFRAPSTLSALPDRDSVRDPGREPSLEVLGINAPVDPPSNALDDRDDTPASPLLRPIWALSSLNCSAIVRLRAFARTAAPGEPAARAAAKTRLSQGVIALAAAAQRSQLPDCTAHRQPAQVLPSGWQRVFRGRRGFPGFRPGKPFPLFLLLPFPLSVCPFPSSARACSFACFPLTVRMGTHPIDTAAHRSTSDWGRETIASRAHARETVASRARACKHTRPHPKVPASPGESSASSLFAEDVLELDL
jgi:hypothetical protein